MNSSGTVRKIIDDNALLTHNIIAHLIPDNASAIITPILTIVLGFVISWELFCTFNFNNTCSNSFKINDG